MKFIKWVPAALFVAHVGVFAQPVQSSCENAFETYAQFTLKWNDFARKNAEIITQASFNEDLHHWLSHPVSQIRIENLQNLKIVQKHLKASCKVNFTRYMNLAKKLSEISKQPELYSDLMETLSALKKRKPARASAFTQGKLDDLAKSFRKLKRNTLMITHALTELQESKCLENMKQEGEFKSLADDEAAAIYTHYLNNYLLSGGAIAKYSDKPFQSVSSTQKSLKKEIQTALTSGNTVYAANLQELVDHNNAPRTFIARKSFHACPVATVAKIKIFLPKGIEVTASAQLKNELEVIYEDATLWSEHQAIQYADTNVQHYPLLVAKNKIASLGTSLNSWINQGLAQASRANQGTELAGTQP